MGREANEGRKRYSFPWPRSLAGLSFNAAYYGVVFTIMHVFSSCRSPICKGSGVVKDRIQRRKETQEMFCLGFYTAKIALEYSQEYIAVVMWDAVAFNTFGISPLISFLVIFLRKKKPLQTAAKTNQKAPLITIKDEMMHHGAMTNAGPYRRTCIKMVFILQLENANWETLGPETGFRASFRQLIFAGFLIRLQNI